jgi:hypothetical protein
MRFLTEPGVTVMMSIVLLVVCGFTGVKMIDEVDRHTHAGYDFWVWTLFRFIVDF